MPRGAVRTRFEPEDLVGRVRPHVVLADALAEAVHSIARVGGVSGDPYRLAGELGMPPWRVQKAQKQARRWNRDTVAEALRASAALVPPRARVELSAALQKRFSERAESARAAARDMLAGWDGEEKEKFLARLSDDMFRVLGAGHIARIGDLARSADQEGAAQAVAVECRTQISGLQVASVLDGNEVIAACRASGGADGGLSKDGETFVRWLDGEHIDLVEARLVFEVRVGGVGGDAGALDQGADDACGQIIGPDAGQRAFHCQRER